MTKSNILKAKDLDPMVSIPASEAWLFGDEEALGAVRRGLQESTEGKLVKMPSLSKHADGAMRLRGDN